MSHAPRYIEPELPTEIKDRLVPHRARDIAENLRSLEAMYPGLFDAMLRTIDMLESEPNIESITVDYDEEDIMYPAMIWVRTSYSLDEREANMARLEDEADEILKHYPDLVLVAIL